MEFSKLYEQQIINKKVPSSGCDSNAFLPVSIPPFLEAGNQIPFLQGVQQVTAGYPFSLELSNLGSYCLLYTESGNGKLSFPEKEYSLTQGSLAVIDCREVFRFETVRSPWHFFAWYMNGTPLPFLIRSILSASGHLYTPKEGSVIPASLKKLDYYIKNDSVSHYTVSKIILNILFEILAELEAEHIVHQKNSTLIPQVKQYLDLHYRELISLESLASLFGISRYKICHQFSSVYKISPIQYVSALRISAAKNLLLETDLKVHEISKQTGFENTNHFIRLFKKRTGMTPLSYKKNPPTPVFTDLFFSV